MLYLNNIIKNKHEIIGIYYLDKWISKEIRFTVIIHLQYPSQGSTGFLYGLGSVYFCEGGCTTYNKNDYVISAVDDI